MTRKKHPPSQSHKRQQITDSEGWTHISRTHNQNKTTYLTKAFTSQKQLLPAEIPEYQTLLDLQDSHAHFRQQWLSSPYRQTLLNLLQDGPPFASSCSRKGHIDRCIVLGLGSLSNGRRNSWWELVFLETVLDFLSSSSPSTPTDQRKKPPGKALEIYVQDPVFNNLDKVFLKSLGYNVLSDPEAFEYMTPSAFLFAPHLEVEVFVRALGRAKPALCVGTDVEECLNRYAIRFYLA